MKRLRQALGFMTILPVPLPAEYLPGDLGRAAVWFGPVGLLLGGLLLAAWAGLGTLFPRAVSAVLLLAVWAGLSGGLHLDGWADCCDGLLNASPPARRLEIMKDPRLGTFGGAGLGLLLLAKYAVLFSLPSLAFSWWLLLLAPTAARWMLMLGGFFPPARSGGLGADFRLGFRPWMFAFSGLLALLLALPGGWAGLVSLAAAGLVAWLFNRFAVHRLGGVTGDVMGATVELTEMVILLTAAASLTGGPFVP
jgi:adenosylcobinamide-GDP ribazoletransferase